MELSVRSNQAPEIKEHKATKTDRSISELNEDELDKRYETTFLKAIRGQNITSEDEQVFERVKSERKFQSAVDADGGLIVPKDVQTKINEFSRSFVALEQLVTNERVVTLTGTHD